MLCTRDNILGGLQIHIPSKHQNHISFFSPFGQDLFHFSMTPTILRLIYDIVKKKVCHVLYLGNAYLKRYFMKVFLMLKIWKWKIGIPIIFYERWIFNLSLRTAPHPFYTWLVEFCKTTIFRVMKIMCFLPENRTRKSYKNIWVTFLHK